MRLSDLVSLEDGIFQLEKGHSVWDPDQHETAMILFAGIETEWDRKTFRYDEEVL